MKSPSRIAKKKRSAFVVNKTVFLFHLSTNTPASVPNKIVGNEKDKTTPETAVFEFVNEKAIRIRRKFTILKPVSEKISDNHRKKKGLLLRETRKLFMRYTYYSRF